MDAVLLRMGLLVLEKDSVRSRRLSSFPLLLRFARFILVGDISAEVQLVFILNGFLSDERLYFVC